MIVIECLLVNRISATYCIKLKACVTLWCHMLCPQHAYASKKVKDTFKQRASEGIGMRMFYNPSCHIKAMHQLYAYHVIEQSRL